MPEEILDKAKILAGYRPGHRLAPWCSAASAHGALKYMMAYDHCQDVDHDPIDPKHNYLNPWTHVLFLDAYSLGSITALQNVCKMAGFVAVFTSWVKLLVPDPCFDEFLVNYNFFHAACLKTVVSKCLGYAIIVVSIMVKVPQISKILSAKSAEGISIVSTTLELTAITGLLAYSYANGFPFSAYGDIIFVVVQTTVISFLVLTYTRGASLGVLYTAVYAAILAYLLSPMAPMSLLWAMQTSVILLGVTARMIQAVTNYRNQSTGQLSVVTVALTLFRSVGRIFTSCQETGDKNVILTYCVATCCNAVILFQLGNYWKSTSKGLPHVRKKTN